MIARPLFNDPTDRFDAFRSFNQLTAALAPSAFKFDGKLHFSDPVDLAEAAFEFFNRADRPNGQYERSVSVGDVIAIFSFRCGSRFYAVENVGFEEVSRLVVIAALRKRGLSFEEARAVADGLETVDADCDGTNAHPPGRCEACDRAFADLTNEGGY
jgi:hypothetical protein